MVSALAWPLPLAAKFLQADVPRVALASRRNGFRFGAALLPDTAGFTPDQRLHSPAEFGRVFAEPVRSSDRFFTVLARSTDRPVARLGLTVSRRNARRAVDRNRLKRLARESFRHQPALPPWDFVVLARPGADRAERGALRASLDRHFAQLTKAAAAAAPHG
jgi:ribonuclease P protein component